MKKPIFKFKLIGETEWRFLDIETKEFYSNEETEFSVFDSVERHFLEPRNYINFQIDTIVFINIIVENELGDKRTITNYTYWNKGLNQIKEYSELENGKLRYSTTIINVCLDDSDNEFLLLRLENSLENIIPMTQVILKGDDIVKSFSLPKFNPTGAPMDEHS